MMGRLTALVSDTTMALVEHGALLGSRQSDMGNLGLIPLSVTEAVLPARSEASPLALWFAPSLKLVDGEHVSAPESASVQV